MPRALVGLVILLAGCGGDAAGADSGLSSACQLAEDSQGCDECFDGTITCTYGDVSATEASCGGCQARASLYQALCDGGETASADDIVAATTCEPAATR